MSDGRGLVLHNEGCLGQPSRACLFETGVWKAGPFGVCSFPAWGLCSAWTDPRPPPPRTWMSKFLSLEKRPPQCLAQDLLVALRIDRVVGKFPDTLPTYPLSAGPLGSVCLRALCRWAQPQREASVTSETTEGRREHPKGPDVNNQDEKRENGTRHLPSPLRSPTLEETSASLCNGGSKDYKEPSKRPPGGLHLRTPSFPRRGEAARAA